MKYHETGVLGTEKGSALGEGRDADQTFPPTDSLVRNSLVVGQFVHFNPARRGMLFLSLEVLAGHLSTSL